jgi:hypothetical protein
MEGRARRQEDSKRFGSNPAAQKHEDLSGNVIAQTIEHGTEAHLSCVSRSPVIQSTRELMSTLRG